MRGEHDADAARPSVSIGQVCFLARAFRFLDLSTGRREVVEETLEEDCAMT